LLEADLHLIAGLFSLPLAPVDVPQVPLRADVETPTTRRVSEGHTHSRDHFIAGPENALVSELAAAAASDPLSYNPVVLCGPIGVGKTSLAHALAALRRDWLQLTSVIATTGSDLVRALAHAIEADDTADFRSRHQQCDLLLIDDVHQLIGKAAAQQFLLAAIDVVLGRGALVIATLRQLPQATAGLAPALASRLAGGLVVPLAPPGQLARRELVRQAASRIRLPITDDVVDRIAGEDKPLARFLSSAQMRHAVLQLAADAPCDLENQSRQDAKLVCKQAAVAVARQSGLTLAELRGKSRRQAIADARGLAMYLVRRLSGASYAEIGRHFGHRDHTTVLHACNKFAGLVANDDATRRFATELESQIAAECHP
jgi:chromosomal replication initiator protein